MTSRAYIVDFSEPGQVANAYLHYFSNFAFLLNTKDELKLFTQVKIRFNFPDGHGTTVVARVVSVLPDNGYGLQLADNSVTKWVIDKAKEYHERMERVRGTARGTAAAAAEEAPPEPPPEDLTTRRIDLPRKEITPTPSARLATAQEEVSNPAKILDPMTKPVGLKKEPVGTPHAQPAEADLPAMTVEAEQEEVGAPEGPGMSSEEAELRRRVADLDRLVAEAGAQPGETLQAAPAHIPSSAPVQSAATEDPAATSEQTQSQQLKEQIAGLSDKQKKKLAISAGEQERRLLMTEPDQSLHLWVLKNPGLTEAEVVDFAANSLLSPDALNFLLQNRRWGTSAAVAEQLVANPNTPPEAIPNLLTVLPQAKLKQLAESPGVRHLVARQARRVLMERSQA